ncbi:gamma-glutamyl-gamma-aminobutyrate hydrolase family protein [Kineococcus gynurae]|uniref:Gamma-glutamyl-gamma-aminobutyrate hydrolase family protein n=1 Tax=Kineococcus gynurae TaxID=452979 RepID=A0ABV5LNZ6_9ACTN
MPRPVIGITSYQEDASWGVWSERADLLPANYADAVRLAGAVPVLLPASAPFLESAREVLARLDGVVVAGGPDIDPARYGATRHARTGTSRADRDAWELAVLDAAAERSLPRLGVCRGMQMMAVHAGGELVQHLPDDVSHDGHDPGGAAFGTVSVRVEPDSVVGALLATPSLDVNCHHHQAVRSHPGFRAVAWAADGTLEAMERPRDHDGAPFVVGIQWHPELVDDVGLFRGLVEAAAGR